MVFATSDIGPEEQAVLALIDELRSELSDRVAEPRRWSGTLRKMTFARAVQGSNSIEGYDASLDDVVAAVEGEPTLDAGEETTLALAGYRDAMTYLLQIADQDVVVDEGLLKSLQFMMLKHDLRKNPGRWRPGAIFVRREATGEVVYEGPPWEAIPDLIAEWLGELEDDESPVLVKAAMAHLNLVLIHPFSDGNGRMGRAVQTLLLARDRLIAPIFSSIEEFLGRNTQSYYDVLSDVGGGSWQPSRNARAWVRFCLRAHYLQMQTTLRRNHEIESLWRSCLDLTIQKQLPERVAAGLMDAAYGLRVRRGGYQRAVESMFGDEISGLTASRDLKAMVDAQLLDPIGENRGRYYVGSEDLRELHGEIRRGRPPRADADPFEIVRDRNQLKLS